MHNKQHRYLRASTDPLIATTPPVLPPATAGVPYSLQLTYVGAIPNETITAVLRPGDSLPPGLTLNPDRTISGTPTLPGTYNFCIDTTHAVTP